MKTEHLIYIAVGVGAVWFLMRKSGPSGAGNFGTMRAPTANQFPDPSLAPPTSVASPWWSQPSFTQNDATAQQLAASGQLIGGIGSAFGSIAGAFGGMGSQGSTDSPSSADTSSSSGDFSSFDFGSIN